MPRRKNANADYSLTAFFRYSLAERHGGPSDTRLARQDAKNPVTIAVTGFCLSYPTKIDTAVAGVLSAAYVFWGFEKSITMVIYALSKISDC